MNERHENIIHYLREHGEVAIEDLVSQLAISEATARRDLARLEKEGALVRTFGGARLADPPSLVVRTFEQKRRILREEKERIARRAVDLIQTGMSVALDSGTTTWCMAAALKAKAPLDVVTNSLSVIEEIGAIEGINIICPGGRFHLTNLDFTGAETARFLSRLHVNIAFLGVDSFIPGRGVFANTRDNADVLAAFAAMSDKCVAVADHTKISDKGLFLAIPSDHLHVLITDDGLDRETRSQLQSEPFNLIIAE